MVRQSMRRLLQNMRIANDVLKGQESPKRLVSAVLCRHRSQVSKTEELEPDEAKQNGGRVSAESEVQRKMTHGSGMSRHSSDDEDLGDGKWKIELAWLPKALEPALQMCRWALPTGNAGQGGSSSPPTARSVSEIIASIQKSKMGVQDWSLGDLTVGLYLIYLRQASANPFEDINGVLISSDAIVQDLMYHTELAKGCYKDSAAGIARNSMLRESNVIKFVKNSSILRPGYYIGIDYRKKLVILAIRGTHSVYDLITNVASSSHEEVTFEGYSTHFGTAEAARWFLAHEIGAIRQCLDKHEGFRLRLVGHSLGGAIASLLAIMLRKKSKKELGFSPELVSAVGYATPPCVSRELAESCSDFVANVVMQDDIVPRLSVASLTRLRNEILQTDWTSIIEKEDWKSIVDLVSNAKQVVSSVQDVARKLADYAKFRTNKEKLDPSIRQESAIVPRVLSKSKTAKGDAVMEKERTMPEELFLPGTVYYLKRNMDCNSNSRIEYFTLWRRRPGDHFPRILLSSNLISDHKCDSHYYALRDVLKALPASTNDDILFQ
ncbi:Lipase_3 domain-containing protein [Psidium guajava]|nr:Lipase_3 domain-containing protein [Psidium guajava]